MPANWTLPSIGSLRTDALNIFKDRDVDAATMFFAATTNQPQNSVRMIRLLESGFDAFRIEEWKIGAWVWQTLSITGGGTSSTSAAGARTNLGLTSIVLQDPANVNLQGTFQLKANLTMDADGTRNIGVDATRPNQVWVRNALVIPVGVDKYAT